GASSEGNGPAAAHRHPPRAYREFGTWNSARNARRKREGSGADGSRFPSAAAPKLKRWTETAFRHRCDFAVIRLGHDSPDLDPELAHGRADRGVCASSRAAVRS